MSIFQPSAVLVSLFLAVPRLYAGPVTYSTTAVVRGGTSEASVALSASVAKGVERYCQGSLCVVLPSSYTEMAALSQLAGTGAVSLEVLRDAHKIFLAKGTYDADTRTFDSDFPGRNEFDTSSANGQWWLVFKAFPEAAWRTELNKLGFTLGESVGPMAYQLYGPRGLLDLAGAKPYVAALVEVPHGAKRFNVDSPRPGDEAGGPAPTTIVVLNSADSTAYSVLFKKAGRDPGIVYRTGVTTAYHTVLTRDECLYLSSFPDVVAVSRETAEIAPSDERTNRILAGSAQSPGSSWPLALPLNTSTPPYWTNYLTFLGILGIQPANQTIAFLDSGLDSAPMQTCPPALVNPASGVCSLVINGHRSLTDITSGFTDPSLRANDYMGHGTLTTAIAAGFAAASGARDPDGYSLPQGVAPGAKVALSAIFGSCAPEGTSTRNEFVYEGYLSLGDTGIRYSLVSLSAGVNSTLPDGVEGAGAVVFNHSWNKKDVVDYTSTDVIMDQSARTLSAITFDYSTVIGGHNVVGGSLSPATHVVSAGNVSDLTATVTSPGVAKNVITVGATETHNQVSYPSLPEGCTGGSLAEADNTHQLATFSRYGFPNLRLKPDFVAPGTRVYAPESSIYDGSCRLAETCNVLVQSGTPAYRIQAGTSYAAPAVSGAVALLREWFSSLGFGAPSPAMTRATLVTGAHNLVALRQAAGTCCDESGQCWSCGDMRPAPDQYQGWGGVALDQYFRPATNYYFLDQQSVLTQGQTWTTTVNIVDPSKPVRLALVWTDAAASPTLYGANNLSNDLDIEVRSTGSDSIPHVWYGNLFYYNRDDLSRTGYSLRDPSPVSYDRKNNQEGITIAASEQPNGLPTGTTSLTITVTAFSVGVDGLDPHGNTPRQDFAVAGVNVH